MHVTNALHKIHQTKESPRSGPSLARGKCPVTRKVGLCSVHTAQVVCKHCPTRAAISRFKPKRPCDGKRDLCPRHDLETVHGITGPLGPLSRNGKTQSDVLIGRCRPVWRTVFERYEEWSTKSQCARRKPPTQVLKWEPKAKLERKFQHSDEFTEGWRT